MSMNAQARLLFCAALLAAGASARAAEPIPQVGTPATVAVLYLDYAGNDDELSALRKGLAQMLISDLSANPQLRLIERLQLESVLGELKLGASKAIDPASAARVGKLLGARYLVMGGYFSFAGSLRVDVRVVNVETGALVRGFGVTGKGDDFLNVERELVAGLEKILVALEPSEGPARKPAEGGEPTPGVKQRPQAPPRLRTKTASRYGKALDLMDKGRKTEARGELEKVLVEEPEFGLASDDLLRLAQ